MIRNHLLFALRLFMREKFYGILNVLGLSLGIGAGIILMLYLHNDLTYDLYHKNHERIYRITGNLHAPGVDYAAAITPRELGYVLELEFPEVEKIARFEPRGRMPFTENEGGQEKTVFVENVFTADSTVFNMFTHQFLSGNPKTCLEGKHKIVLTASVAKGLFGNEPALGKTLVLPDKEVYEVSAVIEDVPDNSHLKFGALISGLDNIRPHVSQADGTIESEAFWNPDVYTYLLMRHGYNPASFSQKFPIIYNKYFKQFGDKIGEGASYTPELENLADIHFHSAKDYDQPQGNMAYVYAFSAIGIMILLLACINYMNMATARSMNRSSEISIRKVIGSGKARLVLSLLGEAFSTVIASAIFALLLVNTVLEFTPFNALIGKNLHLTLHEQFLVPGLLLLVVAVGLLSGLYPAFFMANFSVLSGLKGKATTGSGNAFLRKGLIGFQFMCSIVVIILTLLMSHQIRYVRNMDLGFNKENVVVIPFDADSLASTRLDAFRQTLTQYDGIVSAAAGYDIPGEQFSSSVMWVEQSTGLQQHALAHFTVGPDYLATMGLTLIKGRDFEKGSEEDQRYSFIVNEALVKAMGWKDDPIGKVIKWYHDPHPGHVVGVIKDFNFASLYNPIQPLILNYSEPSGGNLCVRVKEGDVAGKLSFIKEKWASFFPNMPFEYRFLDDHLQAQYQADQVNYKLLSVLTWLCIIVSLVGLLGLSAFNAARRTKEIGIRKVQGATLGGILVMLSKGYVVLIAIAFVLACPIAYYLVRQWLANFAYKADWDIWLFLLPGLVTLVLTVGTVCLQSWRAARMNPARSLRYE